jgi:hypothetical protein
MTEKPKEITLMVGANAEPDTCGSCKFFDRRVDSGEWYSMDGYCRIAMPPLKTRFAPFVYKDNDEDTWGPTHVKDIDRCDLYRPDGKLYIVQRRVGP